MRQALFIALFVVILKGLLLTGCASVREKQALFDWQAENQKRAGNNVDKLPLPGLDETALLNDYLLYALLNNPGLQAAFERWQAALEQVGPARSLPDPRFTYAHYIREVETRVGPQRHRFGLAQTFPWPGKKKMLGEVALQDAYIAQQRYEAAKLALIYQVKSTYYEYSYLGRAVTITKDNVTLLTNYERVARAKYKGGASLQNPLIKAQIELSKLEDRLHSLVDLMQPMAARLNSLLNRPLHLPLPVPDDFSENRGLPFDNTDINSNLSERLYKENPELKIFYFMAAKEGSAANLSGKNFFPDVTLGIDFINTGERTDMEPEDNGKDPVIATLSVNLPIWYHKYNALEEAARTRRRSILFGKKEKENMLVADLQMALYRLRDACRKIDLYGNTLLPKATQTMKVTQSAFTSDKASFRDLIDSQRILLRFQLEYQRALVDRATRLAEIEMLVGGTGKGEEE